MKQSFYKILTCYIVLSLCMHNTYSQVSNTTMESIPFRVSDGKIILNVTINNRTAEFLLDLAGENALTSEAAHTLMPNVKAEKSAKSIERNTPDKPSFTGLCYQATQVYIGKYTFANDMPMLELETNSYLEQLGVSGTINASIFSTSVLTIDMKRQLLTISQPYRPPYMKLNYRTDFTTNEHNEISCPFSAGGKTFQLILDTWNKETIALTPNDFEAWKSVSAPDITFVKTNIENACVTNHVSLKTSCFGTGLLNHGILSIDFLHKKIYFQPFSLVTINEKDLLTNESISIEEGKINSINRTYFIEHIFDYRNNKLSNGINERPMVIDFWATWCGPCMRLLPEIEKMAKEFNGRVLFLKVNADEEKDLCKQLGIQALPTLLFIPPHKKPIMEIGPTPEKIKEIITSQLLK